MTDLNAAAALFANALASRSVEPAVKAAARRNMSRVTYDGNVVSLDGEARFTVTKRRTVIIGDDKPAYEALGLVRRWALQGWGVAMAGECALIRGELV